MCLYVLYIYEIQLLGLADKKSFEVFRKTRHLSQKQQIPLQFKVQVQLGAFNACYTKGGKYCIFYSVDLLITYKTYGHFIIYDALENVSDSVLLYIMIQYFYINVKLLQYSITRESPTIIDLLN